MHLYQNEIENIETIPFNTLYSLKILHLFSNKVRSIKFGNFIHLVKLKELKFIVRALTSTMILMAAIRLRHQG